MEEGLIVAGTGHRPNKLGGYGDAVLGALFRLAKKELQAIGPTKVISGLALGWDTALALAALRLKIPLVAAVPFKGQELIWPEPSQARYRKLIEMAADVRVISSGGYAAWKLQRRNEWMVDHCNILLALWDGTSGGTGNCIRYAEFKPRVKIINCWMRYDPKRLPRRG